MKKKTTKTTKSTKKTKKMPPKNPKIADVATTGKTPPSTTSRPIVVTNRSFIANDPMLVDATKKAEPEDVVAMTHRTARTIQPVGAPGAPQQIAPLQVPSEPEPASVLKPLQLPGPEPTEQPSLTTQEDPDPKTAAAATPNPDSIPEAPESDTSAPAAPELPKLVETAGPLQSEPGEDIPSQDETDAKKADADLQAQAAEEAKNQKLEELIASGTYMVPINAVQRKRSRMIVVTMCILAVLLAVVLADAVLDANLIKLPFTVPHTHFLSAQ